MFMTYSNLLLQRYFKIMVRIRIQVLFSDMGFGKVKFGSERFRICNAVFITVIKLHVLYGISMDLISGLCLSILCNPSNNTDLSPGCFHCVLLLLAAVPHMNLKIPYLPFSVNGTQLLFSI